MKNLKFKIQNLKFRRCRRQRLGQSILEMIFAIGILLMVGSAVLAITLTNLTGQRESEFQIIANNLAREGIEVIRNIRDSNWLAEQNWDNGLVDPGGVSHQAITQFNAVANSWQLSFNPVDDDLLSVSAEGVYNHAGNGQKTVFHRRLTLENICQAADGTEAVKNFCVAAEIKAGIKVTANVSWAESGRNRRLIMEDVLYDWK
ncbi:MAG TPA: hypothetical protein VJG65_02455 [Patescibacteria group bacterium]|nr:hypothetical protein [Patescibacteria group bacterium]